MFTVLRETSQTIPKAPWWSHSSHQRLYWHQSPFAAGLPLLTPHTPRGGVLTCWTPRFPMAVSDASFHKALHSWQSNIGIARAACASQKGPRTKEPLGFYHSPSWWNPCISYPVLGSCCVTECLGTWLCHMSCPLLCKRWKDGQFTTSCLGLLPRAQPAAPTAAAPWATCMCS